MKLAKAIEIGELNLKQTGKAMPPDCHDAVKLLVEAAKAIAHYRQVPAYRYLKALPGEDPE